MVERPPAQKGMQLADFSIDCLDGSEFNRGANIGKVIVVAFVQPYYGVCAVPDPCNVTAQLKELEALKDVGAVVLVVSKCDWYAYQLCSKPVYNLQLVDGKWIWVLAQYPSKEECRDVQLPFVKESIATSFPVAIDVPPIWTDRNEYWKLYGSPDYPTPFYGLVHTITFSRVMPTIIVLDKKGVVRFRNAGLTSGSILREQVNLLEKES